MHHSLSMYSLSRSALTTSISMFFRFVVSGDGILVGVRISSPNCRIYYWIIIFIYRCSFKGIPWRDPSVWENGGGLPFGGNSKCLLDSGTKWNTPL